MSRTVRRKGFNYHGNRHSFAHVSEVDKKCNARWAEFWEARGYTARPDKPYDRWWRRWNDPQLQEVHYHRDQPPNFRGIPSWFCNQYYYRPERAAMRNNIRRAMRCEDWEEVDLFVDIHSDLWWLWT